MKPEQVPDELVELAHAHYSMHGHGLVRNILAAVLPMHERQVREQVAQAIAAAFRRPNSAYGRGLKVAEDIARGKQ